MKQFPQVSERPAGKIPTTNVTNELVRAIIAMSPALPQGQGPVRTGSRYVIVELTSNTADAGKVNGKQFYPDPNNTDGPLLNTNFGTEATSEDVVVWDLSKLNGAIRVAHRVGIDVNGNPVLVVDDRGIIPVRIANDGGSQGTQTTPASWTYTVHHLDNNREIGTGITLARSRPNGTATNSSMYGFGFYDGANFKLWDAGELYGTGGC